ncbi:MAG TPA: histidine kinase, partial [Bacteroidales bacterium]
GDTITSFHIAKNKFRSVNDLQMRFSTNQNAGNDRNYIYLDLSDPSVKDLLGLPRGTFAKKKSINLFARTFVAPVSTIKLFIALCFLIPLLIYVGNKANSYTSVIEKMITNRWLMFNVKAFILNNIIILCILLFTGCFNEPIPASLYFSLLIIATFPANLVYLVENVFLKKRNLFWLRQYLSIVSIIVGLYFTYFLFYNVTDGMLSKKGIYIEYVILSGILVEFMRLINNYISYQKLVSLREKEFEILRLNELKTRSDLNALQSKINPHFLYNALNSIAELCWKDAQKTERMALSLSKLFRYSINKEENDFSSLKKEIELVSLYLSIEKERFGDHLNYQFEYSKDIEDILIPKFILQPLIENAIKHGIAKMPNGGFVKLTIKKIKNETEIKAYDNGPDFPVNWISGYGLKSIYDKLDILYPKRYAIELYNGTEKNITVILKDDV